MAAVKGKGVEDGTLDVAFNFEEYEDRLQSKAVQSLPFTAYPPVVLNVDHVPREHRTVKSPVPVIISLTPPFHTPSVSPNFWISQYQSETISFIWIHYILLFTVQIIEVSPFILKIHHSLSLFPCNRKMWL